MLVCMLEMLANISCYVANIGVNLASNLEMLENNSEKRESTSNWLRVCVEVKKENNSAMTVNS